MQLIVDIHVIPVLFSMSFSFAAKLLDSFTSSSFFRIVLTFLSSSYQDFFSECTPSVAFGAVSSASVHSLARASYGC